MLWRLKLIFFLFSYKTQLACSVWIRSVSICLTLFINPSYLNYSKFHATNEKSIFIHKHKSSNTFLQFNVSFINLKKNINFVIYWHKIKLKFNQYFMFFHERCNRKNIFHKNSLVQQKYNMLIRLQCLRYLLFPVYINKNTLLISNSK